MDRLNVFNPFEDKKLSHEDVLTRNFLILVKNISVVQTAFLELIRNKMPDIELESIALGKLAVSEVYTQTTSGGLLKGIQEHKILSVIISDNEYKDGHIVKESPREARYDGVIICEPSWVFIIENKPSAGNIWEGQLDPNEEDAKGNELISKPCGLSWRDIIDIMNSLLEQNALNHAERTLMDDFLEYINNEYSWLNPYTNLSLCRNNKWLMDRRCGDILKHIFADTGKELKYHKGWKYFIDTADVDGIVREVALDSTEDGIALWMYGGDTMVSARNLYTNIRIEEIDKLDLNGYRISPNFHISYQGTGLAWFTTSKVSLREYINYWRKNRPEQILREDLKQYYERLVDNGIIDQSDEYIQDRILSKGYPKLNICPGIYFGFKWPIADAKKADRAGCFVEDVREKIAKIQSTYMINNL